MSTKTAWLTAAGLGLALATALVFLLEPVNLPAGLHGPDGRNYLSQLHSLLFDRDLLLYDDKALFGQHIIVTSTGYALELHNVGTALAFLPFYALGHLACLIRGGPCTGQGMPVDAFLSLGNWAYGLLALLFIFRLVQDHVPRRRAAGAVAVLALGSPFFYYWTRFFNPHMPALCLVALLVLVWRQTRVSRGWHHWLLMGALAGLATTVANYNVAFLLLPASDLIQETLRRRALPLAEGLLLLVGTLAGLAPQLVVWRLMFGTLIGTPYGQQLFWLEPGLPEVLLSSYHGLYFYAPALALATLGFVPLYRQDRALALKSLLAFAAHVYVSSCNIAWWAGASFGPRYLLTSLPLLALPLASLLSEARWRVPIWAALLAGVGWTYGLFLADFARLVDPGQYIPPRWQLQMQVQVLQDLPHLVRQHLLTPRFDAAPLYALPFALLLTGLALVAGRLRNMGRWLALGAAALPLVAAAGLAWSNQPSQREIARMAAEGALDSYPRRNFDFYDLAEGYRQRGAYRFVRGDREHALADFETAYQLLPSRDWVRFHRAGRDQVPNPLQWEADGRLTLVGWEAVPGSVTLYWLAQAPVLEPGYRTGLRLKDAAGNDIAAYAPAAPDPWRALAGDIVRIRYPVSWGAGAVPQSLAISLYTADGLRLVGKVEVGADE